jgi:hypothetical protein
LSITGEAVSVSFTNWKGLLRIAINEGIKAKTVWRNIAK